MVLKKSAYEIVCAIDLRIGLCPCDDDTATLKNSNRNFFDGIPIVLDLDARINARFVAAKDFGIMFLNDFIELVALDFEAHPEIAVDELHGIVCKPNLGNVLRDALINRFVKGPNLRGDVFDGLHTLLNLFETRHLNVAVSEDLHIGHATIDPDDNGHLIVEAFADRSLATCNG